MRQCRQKIDINMESISLGVDVVAEGAVRYTLPGPSARFHRASVHFIWSTIFCTSAIAFAAQGKFLHHQQHFRMVFEVKPAIGKLLAEAVEGRKPGRARRPAMQGDKFCSNQLGQSFDEVLLGREVIVQGGDIHSGAMWRRRGCADLQTPLPRSTSNAACNRAARRLPCSSWGSRRARHQSLLGDSAIYGLFNQSVD